MPKKKKKTRKRTTSKTATRKTKKAARGKQLRRSAKPAKKKQSRKKTSSRKSLPRRRTSPPQQLESWRAKKGAASDRQSGDLEGLSRAEQADSQSVDELVEEGNVFEAGAVAGVEEADDEETKEVHTHEAPEDDVPDEYLEKAS
jgi:hypothetical protein